MRYTRAETLRRSTGFRVAVIQAALLTAAMLGAGIATWLSTRLAFETEMRERIALETGAIRNELDHEGMPGAAAAVDARVRRPGSLVYRLENAAGTKVAGDLEFRPAAVGWQRLDLGEQELLIYATRTRTGARLTVGGDLEEGEVLRNRLLGSLALWGGIALALGLALGLWLTRHTLARIGIITEVVEQTPEGDLAKRIGLPPASDDLSRLAQRIDAMLDRIAALVSAQRRISADVAHELRTPLADLAFKLEMMANAADVEARASLHEEASAALNRATSLFDAMLRLAEIEAGTARARFAMIDLGILVSDIAEAYRPEIEATGRTLILSIAQGCTVVGDADLVTQTVANLLDNELKFAPAQGAIHLSLDQTGGGIALSVGDDGPGIAASDFSAFVQPFGRARGSVEASGAGLGLAIVHAVVQLHGGQLANVSSKGSWCVRWVWPG